MTESKNYLLSYHLEIIPINALLSVKSAMDDTVPTSFIWQKSAEPP